MCPLRSIRLTVVELEDVPEGSEICNARQEWNGRIDGIEVVRRYVWPALL